MRFVPQTVEGSILVNTLVGVRSEKVTLGLPATNGIGRTGSYRKWRSVMRMEDKGSNKEAAATCGQNRGQSIPSSTCMCMYAFRASPHLDQVGWQAGPAVGVEVRQGRSHGWRRDSARHAQSYHTPPSRLTLHDLCRKVRVNEEVGKVGVADVCALDIVQECSPDNAPALPDASALPKVDVPSEVFGSGLNEVHAL